MLNFAGEMGVVHEPRLCPWRCEGEVTPPMLRIRDVGACLGVSHQRADQMFREGKFLSRNGSMA